MTFSRPEAWTEAAPGVRVRQSTVFAMNSVLLASPEHAVLIDPGVLPSELDDLARAASETRAAETTLVFTHADWDHVLGRPWWPDAATIAHDRFAGEVKRRAAAILAEAVETATKGGERWERGFEPFQPRVELSGLRFLRVGPWRVVFRNAYGHSGSMLSVHLPESRVLIAADMLSDLEIPILKQPVRDYRDTLLELEPLADRGAIEVLIPGHGSVARGRADVLARLTQDLGYLEELERRVQAAQRQGRSLEQTQETLADMALPRTRAAAENPEYHRRNIHIAYHGKPAT